MLLRLILFGIVLSTFTFAGHSQKVSEYKFTVLNTTVGLAGNMVTDITQDHNGFIWIASDGGLQRYDGKRFLTFKNRPGDLQSLPYSTIELVFEDKKHNLWILTTDGRIGLFNTGSFTYKEVAVGNPKKENIQAIRTLVEDSSGNLYLSMRDQPKPFFRFSAKDQAFLPADLNNVLPATWKFKEFFYDGPSNRFWFTTDSGLVVHDPVKRQTSYRGHNVAADPVINILGHERFATLPYVDQQRNFWCVIMDNVPFTPPVIHRVEPETAYHESFKPWADIRTNYRQVMRIFSQRNGRVWLAGAGFLMEYKKNSRPAFDTVPVNDKCNPKSLTFNGAYGVFEDRENSLWISTTDGVIRFTPDANFFSNYLLQKDRNSTPEAQAALAVYERKNGELWIGCGNAGLYTYSRDFTPIIPKGDPVANFPAKTAWSFYEDPQTGLIWMGMSKGQIGIYDPQTGKIDSWTEPTLDNHPAQKIAADKNGNLWFITQTYSENSRLVKWDRKLAGNDYKKGFILVRKINSSVSNILVDPHNSVWVGTLSEGLQKFNAETNQFEIRIDPGHEDNRSTQNDNAVTDLEQYNDSTIVTVGNVVSFINTRTNAVTFYSRKDGLPGGALSVLKDKSGILWLGTFDRGICRFNPSRKIFSRYTTNDGMIDDIFYGSTRTKLADGRLVFATSSCLVAFNPDDLSQKASAPAALFTDFKLLNISLPLDSLQKLSRLDLPYDQNSVTIEFSALSFAPKNKISYYYQMEGLDKEWIAADETQKAIYNYLPAGKYTFKIKTDNGADGNNAITTLAISVHAAFWKTVWFWALIVLGAAGILYLLDRERVKRLVSMQKMRTEIALNLHKDVTSTLSNINLLSEMARIKADKDLDRSKEYIQQISDKSNRMIVAMDDILWSIEPENDSMEKSLLRMREFIDELKNRYNAEITLVADKYPASISLDMKKRHEFFLIFKEALRTVVEYAEGRDTLIHLDASKNNLLFNLQDATANPDIQRAALEEGFREIRNRSAQIKAEVDIQYDKNGIAVMIQVPLA